MIDIREISVNETNVFWDKHIKYLVEDEIVTDKEEIEYFLSSEYRDFLENRMIVDKDRHYIAYFFENDIEIGAVQFTICTNEDGKYFGECFILDFWIYPEFRNKSKGLECFKKLEKYTKSLGANHYVLNSMKDNSIRFWEKLGFVENGIDEWGMKLFRLY